MPGPGFIIWVVLLVFVLLVLAKNVVIVQQSKAYVIERLGAFHTVWGGNSYQDTFY